MTWDALGAISTAISMVAFILTALYVRDQVKGLEKDRYLHVTNDLFTTWQGREFMEAQLWLVHRMEETTWQRFIEAHRGDFGEIAFHRVGSFYDRVGTLVRLGYIDEREILATMGGYAIAVWRKIEPLVREARRIEHSELFSDFERLIPACLSCYVPALGAVTRVAPFTIAPPVPRLSREQLKARLDAGDDLTTLDVRRPTQVAEDRRTLPRAMVIPPDEVEGRHTELPAGSEIVVYCA